MVCETEAKALSPLAKISNNVPVSPLIASLNTNFMYVEFNYNEKYSLFCGSRIFEKHNNHRSNQRERVGEWEREKQRQQRPTPTVREQI